MEKAKQTNQDIGVQVNSQQREVSLSTDSKVVTHNIAGIIVGFPIVSVEQGESE